MSGFWKLLTCFFFSASWGWNRFLRRQIDECSHLQLYATDSYFLGGKATYRCGNLVCFVRCFWGVRNSNKKTSRKKYCMEKGEKPMKKREAMWKGVCEICMRILRCCFFIINLGWWSPMNRNGVPKKHHHAKIPALLVGCGVGWFGRYPTRPG